MYLEKLRLENTGPIDFLEIEFDCINDMAPKPLILVGRNGSGKSIILSHIVSAMMNAHNAVYEDGDMEQGKVYKLRSPQYIRRNQDYSLSRLNFSNGFFEAELTLTKSKKDFEDQLQYAPIFPEWAQMPVAENSYHASNFQSKKEDLLSELTATNIYFPPNRFEEPAWLNETNLKNKVEYEKHLNIKDISRLSVIEYSPMKQNQSWLLDLIYDAIALERQIILVIRENNEAQRHIQQDGPASKLKLEVDKFIATLLGGQLPLKWSLGRRSYRSLGIAGNDGSILANNLFSLSTGQAVLLDTFLTILRHADTAQHNFVSLADIKGIVVIDEVDLHLHADLQHEILPALIRSFPGIQFILTTHSPLFLLGMEKAFGEDQFRIIELPDGKILSAERFSEFERAYSHLTSTRKFENDIGLKVSEATQPLLILEGKTDIDYVNKAAELLGVQDLLDRFDLVDGDGAPGLNKIWKNLHTNKWTSANQTVVLLYDCDMAVKNNEIGKAYQRTIPAQKSKISKGIENLFSTATINRAIKHKKAFIDYQAGSFGIERGNNYKTPESWQVNINEKRNLCDWLCKGGTKRDFKNFSKIFDILRDCLR